MPSTRASWYATLAIVLTMLFVGVSRAAPDDHAAAPPTGYIDLTQDFVRFVDDTAGMEEATRVANFRKQMNALLPGFYTPRNGIDEAHYNAQVARSLRAFSGLRPAYLKVQGDFPLAFRAGVEHFRKVFANSTSDVTVYLVHSLGEMDGGTRNFGGKTYLIFGADVISKIHDARSLGPFFDHELFHVENGKYFPECDQVWCALWAEGLATYAAQVMNPGADDAQLLLTKPEPIRAAVDARWSAALCFTRAKLDSSEMADLDVLFSGGAQAGQFPRRFGYYVGLRIIEELGRGYGLRELARMTPARARTVLVKGLERLIGKSGGCKSPAVAR